MDNDILNIARNLVVDLRRAGDAANVVPSVQGSFYSLSASLDIVLAEIIRTVYLVPAKPVVAKHR